MKKILALAAALVLVFSCTICFARTRTHKLTLELELEKNRIMARYDVDVYLNGSKEATINQGETYKGVFRVPEGISILTFYKAGTDKLYAIKHINVNKDVTFSCQLNPNMTNITLEKVNTNSDPVFFQVGEKAMIKDMYVTLDSVRTEAMYGGEIPRKHHEFVVATMVIENRTNENKSFSSLLSELTYQGCCDDFEVDMVFTKLDIVGDALIGGLYEKEMPDLESLVDLFSDNTEIIHPGKKFKIEVVFEAPFDWEKLDVFYVPSGIGEQLNFVAYSNK